MTVREELRGRKEFCARDRALLQDAQLFRADLFRTRVVVDREGDEILAVSRWLSCPAWL